MKIIKEWKSTRQAEEDFLEWYLYRKLTTKGILVIVFVLWLFFVRRFFDLAFWVTFFKWALVTYAILAMIKFIVGTLKNK